MSIDTCAIYYITCWRCSITPCFGGVTYRAYSTYIIFRTTLLYTGLTTTSFAAMSFAAMSFAAMSLAAFHLIIYNRIMRRPCIRCRSVSAEADLCAQCMIKPCLYPRLIAPFPKIRRSNIRLKNGLIRFQRQGPAAAYTTLALNTTEVYSMESTSSIPHVYRFSIADPSNNI